MPSEKKGTGLGIGACTQVQGSGATQKLWRVVEFFDKGREEEAALLRTMKVMKVMKTAIG